MTEISITLQCVNSLHGHQLYETKNVGCKYHLYRLATPFPQEPLSTSSLGTLKRDIIAIGSKSFSSIHEKQWKKLRPKNTSKEKGFFAKFCSLVEEMKECNHSHLLKVERYSLVFLATSA